MMEQLSFLRAAGQEAPRTKIPSVEHFQGAMVLSAIGDALGWPTESLDPRRPRRPSFELPIRGFVGWNKQVGGKWWGYTDRIRPGEYSDDTQLTLAVARCIALDGEFQPSAFAYSELTSWLDYERGGGKSVKIAARTIRTRKSPFSNFYKQQSLDYRQAGANGAAMRNLPITLASAVTTTRLVRDSFLNTIITHGHPRAIIGTLLIAFAGQFALLHREQKQTDLIPYVLDNVRDAAKKVTDNSVIRAWISQWESVGNDKAGSFRRSLEETRDEIQTYLAMAHGSRCLSVQDYYSRIGALTTETKGSGVACACAAIFLYLAAEDSPMEAIFTAANVLGSDTDTIACLVGGLVGARYGLAPIPSELADQVQDHEYLRRLGVQLHAVATEQSAIGEANSPIGENRLNSDYGKEDGSHDILQDSRAGGDIVFHPVLGTGVVEEVTREAIPLRDDYEAMLIRVRFATGQTCVFHSRLVRDSKQAN